MAKIEIPAALKADIPKTLFGRIMSATPVVMTVVATMLAGLASSEMTKAQYDRSLAAQQQSKAGDQWSFFQAKRLRSALQRNTLDILEASAPVHPLDPAGLQQAVAASDKLRLQLDNPAGQNALALLQKGELPVIPKGAPLPDAIRAALDAIEAMQAESEIASLLGGISHALLTETIVSAKKQADAFDEATQPVNQTIDALNAALLSHEMRRDFIVVRTRFAALRYDAEARLNQTIANLYELQVRKNNISAERHHGRSQRFFYGMLGAQAAVIISTFSIAARQRNLLWTLAAAAGVTALLFAGYVYLYV